MHKYRTLMGAGLPDNFAGDGQLFVCFLCRSEEIYANLHHQAYFADGHHRQLPRLVKGPFKYGSFLFYLAGIAALTLTTHLMNQICDICVSKSPQVSTLCLKSYEASCHCAQHDVPLVSPSGRIRRLLSWRVYQ